MKKVARLTQSSKWSRFKNKAQSGQTLVEYALILSLVCLLIVDEMEHLSQKSTESFVYVGSGLVMSHANLEARHDATQDERNIIMMVAIDDYLSAPDTWGDTDPNFVEGAVIRIHNSYHTTIFGS